MTFDVSVSFFVYLKQTGRLLPVEDELVVDVVHDEPDPLALAEVDEPGDQALGVEDARGVVRAVADDDARRRPDGLLDVLRPRDEAAVLGLHDDRDAVAHPDHLGVADPVGGEDDDLVLRVQDRVEDVEDRLLRPGRDDDVLGGDDAVVVLLGVPDDLLLQPRGAVGRRVLHVARVQLRGGREDGGDRGLVLRLAGAEVDDGLALFAQEPGLLVQAERGRLRDRFRELTDAHVVRNLPFRRWAAGARTPRRRGQRGIVPVGEAFTPSWRAPPRAASTGRASGTGGRGLACRPRTTGATPGIRLASRRGARSRAGGRRRARRCRRTCRGSSRRRAP